MHGYSYIATCVKPDLRSRIGLMQLQACSQGVSAQLVQKHPYMASFQLKGPKSLLTTVLIEKVK